jgi:hypothetical protein
MFCRRLVLAGSISPSDIDKLYNAIVLAPRSMKLLHAIVKSRFKAAVKK